MRIFIILLLFISVSYAQTLPETPPKILSDADANLYAEIFALQDVEKNAEADKLIARLDDKILLGYVQFQRYMHPGKYRANFLEMKKWMENYGDFVGAKRVYNLARRRNPGGHKNPKPPRDTFIPERFKNDFYDAQVTHRYNRTERAMLRKVRVYVHNGNVTVARKYAEGLASKISKQAYAAALGHVARGYYRYNKYRQAIFVGEKAMSLAPNDVASSIAAWWGGLASWRLQDYDKASTLFAHVEVSENQDEWLRSAGAFWSARAYAKLGQTEKATAQHRKALQAPHSFYGLLSAEALQEMPQIDWDTLPTSPVKPSQLLEIPAVRQALALNEAGQGGRAEAVLKPIIKRINSDANVALLQWLIPLQMAHSSYAVADFLETTRNEVWFSAYYPEPVWLHQAIAKNKLIDSAVVFGMVRQESAFQRRAKSSANASGLMQLIPSTANFVNRKRIPKSRRHILYDADENVRLGQKYISHLLQDPKINNNLLLMAIAYNAGPGNLNKWRRNMKIEHDPLLFIESLPWLETRIYAERIMANMWMYRLRLGSKRLLCGRW